MNKLLVALVLLQTCWGIHAWSRNMENEGYIEGDIVPSKSNDEELDAGLVLPKNSGDWNPNMEHSGDIQGDIVPNKKSDEKLDAGLVLPKNSGDWNPNMEHSGDIQGDIVPNKKSDEESDAALGLKEDAAESVVITKRSSKRGSQWPGGIVPYVIDGRVSRKTRQLINSAIADFKKYTCIRFVPRRGQRKYAIFTNRGRGSGCNSPIGVPKGRNVNKINLEEPGCQKHGTVLHEMCHTIGLHHEQTRVDRNRYVRFIKRNVKPGMFEVNFQSKANDPKYWQSFNTPYDYYSIMHYGAFAFSRNGKRTIITTDPNVQYLIGTMDHMSPIDAKQINLMYKCPNSWRYQKPPTFKCVDTKKRCDMYIAKYKCPKVYGMCCKSCRDGVKCSDYNNACSRVARQGACNYGNVNYRFAKQNCCKSCKGR